MNPNETDVFADWSDTFDDMDGGDWEDHFALVQPDDDNLATQYEYALQADQEFWEYEAARRLGEIALTATLGDLAHYACRIVARCLKCRHRAVLNPETLLDKVDSAVKISALHAKLRCLKCGARSAAAHFNPESIGT